MGAAEVEELMYSVVRSAELSGLGRTKIFEAMRSGELVAVKVGRRTLIRRSDLVAWIESLPARSVDPEGL